jgi:phenylalanyl-tRNA synthetase beta chain
VKLTYRWLQEFAPITDTPAVLADALTLTGLEVEALAPVAPPFTKVVVGEVLATARHPDAERLSVCEVTTDGTDRLQIVCGATNVRAGLRVAVALVGAHLPNDVAIKRAKLRGLESEGMLCSARELGLGSEHDGIMELPPSAVLGQDLRTALDLDDTIIEVKATPNRGDCMSVFGIARDYVAARERRYLRYPPASGRGAGNPARDASPPAASPQAVAPLATPSPPAVQIDAPQACSSFVGRVIRGVRPGLSSPTWLRERLRRIGINSISAVVDVTNYVAAELGQPLHAYDRTLLRGAIHVRHAHAGERLTLLDDQDYGLDPDFLVIADDSGAIGLAGIMGGRSTAITDRTTDLFLEAAHFKPDAIAGRARRLGLFTDAAQRFERGVDPALPPLALERATALILEIVGGEPGPIVTGHAATAASSAPRTAPSQVSLRRDRLTRLLGAPVPDPEVLALLSAISEHVEATVDGWRVTVPTHRFDLKIEADLIEEIARLRGFDAIPEAPAVVPQVAGSASESRVASERLLAAFAGRGYREAITYSFVDPSLQRQLFPETPALALANPISAELSEMRVSLWPGLLEAARQNLRRQQVRVRLFEIGKQFALEGSTLTEIEVVAGLATGARWPEQWGSPATATDFYDVKADLEEVLALAGDAAALRFEPANLPCLRPGRSAQIHRGAFAIGWLGELHPRLVRALGLPAAPLLFMLELEAAFASNILQFKRISKYPSVRRDLAVVVDESVPLAVLQEHVNVSAAGLLSELRIFDIYRGSNIEIGRKSIALGLILQDSSRTLTDVDADAVVARVVARLRDVLSAAIRDQ